MRRPMSAQLAVPAPAYELRASKLGLGNERLEIWQIPSPTTPQLSTPKRLGGLRGRNLELVEHRIRRRLATVGVRTILKDRKPVVVSLPEDVALTLSLLFRALAPMRSRDRMRAVAEGIDAMGREEAAYWLGMAMHRTHPRRVLTALRILLTAPGSQGA